MKVVTIGRSPENDVVINDAYIGRHHCQIMQYDNGTYGIVDLDSANGTFVNGNRVNGSMVLNHNDVVRIGNTTLPWVSYFGQHYAPPRPTQFSRPQNDDRHYGYQPPRQQSDQSSNQENSFFSILSFMLGLVSLGIIIYLVIDFFTSAFTQMVGFLGGTTAKFKLFPIYLRGYFGIGGEWFAMIVAFITGALGCFIYSRVLKNKYENKITSIANFLATIGLFASILFILLAIFAEQIVTM